MKITIKMLNLVTSIEKELKKQVLSFSFPTTSCHQFSCLFRKDTGKGPEECGRNIPW